LRIPYNQNAWKEGSRISNVTSLLVLSQPEHEGFLMKITTCTTLLLAALLILFAHQTHAQQGPPGGFGPPGFDGGPPGLDPDFIPPGRNPEFSPPRREAPARGQDDDNGDGNGNRRRGPAFCAGPVGGGPNGQAGLSSIAHLDFSQAETDDEQPVASGRLMYRWIAPVFDFVFNARGLMAGSEYTLTYQPQPLPSAGVICLGAGTATEDGDLHVQNALDIATDLPAAYDENEDLAILALVPSASVDCESGDMLEWDEDAYLFGDEGMFYVHSELEEDDDDEDNDD
jgi:hypothetical protein